MFKCCLNFKITAFSFLLFFVSILSSDIEAKTIIIDDPDWPPFFFGLEKNRIRGIGKEIISKALSTNGYKFRFENLPIKRAKLYMKKGELDIAVFSYKKERESFVLYCNEPLYVTSYRFVVRADSNIKINSLNDLKPLTFGYLDGLSFSPEMLKIIRNKDKKGQVVKIYSMANLIRGIAGKHHLYDITADSYLTLLWKSKSMKLRDRIKILDYNICSKKYYVAVSKRSDRIKDKVQLKKDIDRYIRTIKKNGIYNKIFKSYILESSILPDGS